MPVRPRRQRRRRVEWSPRIALALSIGPLPGSALADATLAEAWRVYGVLLLDGYPPDRRPWAWWACEPHVPDELRGERPRLVTLDESRAYRAELDNLERRRAAWLAEHPGAGSATPT